MFISSLILFEKKKYLFNLVGSEKSCVGPDHVHLVGGQDVDGPVHGGAGDVEDEVHNVGGHYVQVLFVNQGNLLSLGAA